MKWDLSLFLEDRWTWIVEMKGRGLQEDRTSKAKDRSEKGKEVNLGGGRRSWTYDQQEVC